ncbi:hypothetical protein SISNIDRAFT_492126 [Sistotremastrum niveocremeum HHB9708]|uniref:Uncharacterized protein n=2 Tax=Sistotremastraceae TaxID=3402574 RepID=A0A164M1Y8_9AGAM|nr:hypothetical protein SISNIDRAFT_492126 [Sistotremastrum niveocremeum HHB9708]KZT35370.1 hypothetical protein SISSUDRAFT_1035633 [Sistotremastrum suecicum HHB10207 ss-3]
MLAFGILTILWLISLSFSCCSRFGLLTALRMHAHTQDPVISRRFTGFLSIIFLLATIDCVTVILSIFFNINPIALDWISLVSGFTTLAIQFLTATHHNYRLYIVFERELRSVAVPSVLSVASLGCGIFVTKELGRMLPSDPSHVSLVVAFFCLFGAHSAGTAICTAIRLLGQDARLLRIIQARVHHGSPSPSPPSPTSIHTTLQRSRSEYAPLARVLRNTGVASGLYMCSVAIAYSTKHPVAIPFVALAPHIAAIASTLSFIQIALLVTRDSAIENAVILSLARAPSHPPPPPPVPSAASASDNTSEVGFGASGADEQQK